MVIAYPGYVQYREADMPGSYFIEIGNTSEDGIIVNNEEIKILPHAAFASRQKKK